MSQHRHRGSGRPSARPPFGSAALGALALIGSVMGALSGTAALNDVGRTTVSAAASIAPVPSSGPRPRTRIVSRASSRATSPAENSAARAAALRGRAIARLTAEAGRRESDLRNLQWTAPLESYRITGTFGLSSYLWSSTHTGLDLAAPSGTPILAVGAGEVSEAGWAGSYGNRTIVTTTDGTEVWYCHQTEIDVTTGESVSRGQQIGTVGSTGNVTGPHLHIEVRPGGGSPVDPYGALMDRGVAL